MMLGRQQGTNEMISFQFIDLAVAFWVLVVELLLRLLPSHDGLPEETTIAVALR